MPTTRQLEHWAGDFGDAYTDRNEILPELLRQRTRAWARILEATRPDPPQSFFETGCNIGYNQRALQAIIAAEHYAIEPNATARARILRDGVIPEERLFAGAGQSLPMADASVDLAFTSGVLIHVAPDDLYAVCSEVVRIARKYVVCWEYFSDQPEEIAYRGHQGMLFKRDYGGFYLDNFPELRPLDYGFFWNRTTGMDNATWWLFGK